MKSNYKSNVRNANKATVMTYEHHNFDRETEWC